ncbi:RseA family anti-sigma factor [Paraglaciecola aquimarina]|uniref:RseA family anti-sigma factor n=1 Tax=Paraglaciecola aquimarina TaxID=1235557 RepID=A0ABU3SWI4_9ALTE|nr:RseA family anti-sigma factor [Paraglaciecola aquimarina]MDU0354382.1 RseA family anti-sigma factor [Paraglaciecola aquimarina]
MSQKFENLSAFIDGETASSDNVVDAVKRDADLMQKWKNYHLIRDGLRQELPTELNFDIAAKVTQALESEPAILAPKKTWRDIPLVGSVIPFAKQGGQMAVAASVAVAMILGVQQMNQTDVEQPYSPASPILGVNGGLSPVSFDVTRTLPQADTGEQKRRIHAYLLDHKQQMRFKVFQVAEPINEITVSEQPESEIVENIPE